MAKYKVNAQSVYLHANSAGTAIALTAYVDSISVLGKEVDVLDVTAFSDAAERIIVGIEKSQEWTIAGFFDDAATTGPDAVLGTMVGALGTFAWSPVGTAAGARKFSGTALCLAYHTRAAVKGRVEYEARFKLDGTITVGTN